jgi:hypothetical protein
MTEKSSQLPHIGKKSSLTSYPCGLVFKNSRETLDYNEEAFALSLASLLGDGHLRDEGRIQVEQAEEDYTKWKKQQFIKYGLATERSKISEVPHIRRNKETGLKETHFGYRFFTRSFFKAFKKFVVYKKPGDPTYVEGQRNKRRKAFTVELFQCFKHPLALAVFYMDDGGVADNQAYFATGEVPLNEVKLLADVFLQNFGLKTTIRFSEGVAVGLLVKRESCGTFLDLVETYVKDVPGMERKLEITRP